MGSKEIQNNGRYQPERRGYSPKPPSNKPMKPPKGGTGESSSGKEKK
ncbi:MAG: hypothetical protein AB9844_00245 [Clostridiaceae bacterium]